MNIHDIRRLNLRLVINMRFDGVERQLALAMGKHGTALNRYFSRSESARNISTKLANEITAAANLPSGWMDQQHPGLWRQHGVNEGVHDGAPEYGADQSQDPIRNELAQEINHRVMALEIDQMRAILDLVSSIRGRQH